MNVIALNDIIERRRVGAFIEAGLVEKNAKHEKNKKGRHSRESGNPFCFA